MSELELYDGRILRTHEPDQCAGPVCCIHNPSDHPLRDAPADWWAYGLLLRICPHNLSHPDPDSLDYLRDECRFMLVEAVSSSHIDRCDGCCRRPLH